MKVPLTRPWSDDAEMDAVRQVLESGWWTQGPKVAEFERIVARYVEAQTAVACSSGTAALHIAMLLMGAGPGDEVIIPSYTWIATANAVRFVGAMPVFADIDLDTFNLDPADVERRVTTRTRGIVPVHQFGLPADLDALWEIAQRHNLWIVEDAACALGSAYKRRTIGSHSDLVCFSFHPRKVVSTGEGGVIAINRPELEGTARSLISHGASLSDRAKDAASRTVVLKEEEFPIVGYNYRLTDLQAAVGVEQMKKADKLMALRVQRGERYNTLLADVPWVIRPTVPEYATFNYQSYVVRLADGCPMPQDQVAQWLLDAGVACRPGYMACHVQPMYRALNPDVSLPNTDKALESVIILPLYPQMTDAEQDYVVRVLSKACCGRPEPLSEAESHHQEIGYDA